MIAMSADGRRIACVGDGNQVVVWTPYATKQSVPDHHRLRISGMLNDVPAFERLVKQHGPAIFNVPDAGGLSVLLHAVEDENVELVKSVLNYARDTETDVLFFSDPTKMDSIQCTGECRSVLQIAIARRSPEIVGILIHAMYDGVVPRNVMASIFSQTLVPLGKIYPSIFMDAIMADGMPTTIGDLIVPEGAFKETGYVVGTMSMLLPPKHMLQRLWGESHAETQRCASEVEVPALARVFPYPHCCQIGMKGLLRPLLVSDQIPTEAFSSQLVHSIITYKWQAYAYRMVLTELIVYSIYIALFTTYSIVLGHDREAPEDLTDVTSGATGVVQTFFLLLSACFGLLNLIWEVNQILTNIGDGHKAGLQWPIVLAQFQMEPSGLRVIP